MTTDLLRKALYNYLDTAAAIDNADKAQIERTIDELDEIDRRAGADDAWQHACYILHSGVVCDLLNEALYDHYGKLYAATHSEPSYKAFEELATSLFPTLSPQAIELAYDDISALYRDNEALGNHNPDGTFRHDDDRELNTVND